MKAFKTGAGTGWILFLGFALVCLPAVANAAELGAARVTQIINDVKLFPGQAAARAAVVNDNVGPGTAVRTGTDSRTELTFSDLTITRLGANTIFSFNEAAREINVAHGSILLQVPPKSAPAKITTAAVTAAVSGGTALFGTGPPVKFMVLEGIGTFYPAGHPEEAVTLHGGEMVTLGADGHLATGTFNVKTVVETSLLIVGFPDLANLPLILQVMDQQQTDWSLATSSSSPPLKDTIDVTSLNTAANPNVSGSAPGPTGPPSEFGPPTTITSPDPYVITSGTQINTGPTITTNGVTDFGKIYRGPALDGSEFDYLFGSTSSFDATLGTFFNANGNGVPVAVFKFSNLELTGNPTITIPSGATTFLGLVSVGDVTSGAPGGTLTFAGLDRLFIATQSGSITLGSEIAFSGISHLTFYARGTGSNLTLASPISGADVVHLDSEGTVQINGDIAATTEFRSFSGGDFLVGTGMITAQTIDIESLSNLNIDARQFPDPAGDVTFIAGGTLNATLNPGSGGTSTFTGTSLTAQGTTINITSSINPTTFDLGTATVMFTAGSGGFQAPTIDFVAGDLTLTSVGDISVYGLDVVNNTLSNTVTTDGSFTAASDVRISTLMAGTFISIGGDALVSDMTAGSTIDVTGQLGAFGTVAAGGNITANGVDVVTIDAPNGVLTVGANGIRAFVESPGGAAVQETFNVNSIVSPAGIDYSGNQFDGIDGLSSGGKLTINATTITFDSANGIAFANFNGADAGSFDNGGPASGGDGGTFIVNATGNIIANIRADITATTGNNASGDFGFSGAGGTVKLISSGGSVTVDDTIQVSSDDPIPGQTPPPPIRRSASGGTILLQSNLTSGQGITVGANAQLLSLLDPNAPGPGGSITLSTMGANITVTPGAVIEADRGTITMDQNDPAGPTPLITIDGATLTSDTLNITGAGDVNIGLSNPVTINANTISLSAPGSIQFNTGAMSADEFDAATGGGDLTLQFGGSLSLDGKVRFNTNVSTGVMLASGANLTLNVTGDYTNSSTTEFSLLQVTNQGHIGTGGNISVDITGNLTAAGLGSATAFPEPGDVELLVQNTNAQIDTGGNLNLTVGGNVNVNGLALYVQNYDETMNPAGHIGTGGNIDVQIAGNLNATSYVDVFLNNRGGGTITSGGNLTFNVTGALTIGADAGGIGLAGFSSEFIISNRYDDIGGNTAASSIGSDVSLFLHAASVDMAGDLFGSGISNRGGSTIGGDATATWDVTDNLTIRGTAGTSQSFSDADWFILNDAVHDADAQLTSPTGGTINGNATLTLTVGGDTNIAGDAFFEIGNQRDAASTAPSGGSIIGNAVININAANFSVGGELDVDIFNQKGGSATGSGGSIGGNATINLNVTDNLTATGTDTNSSGIPGDMAFDIFNQRGSITSDATVNIQTANVSAANDFVAQIVNFNGGTIGGKAALTLSATGDVNTGGLAFFGLFNNPGAIGSDASVDVSAASLTAGSFFEAFIENIGGTIGRNATVQVGTTGDLNADHLFVVIDSSSGGSVGGNETINMNVSGTATVNNEATVQILGPDPTGSAAINFNGGTYEIGGTFFNTIDGDGTITFSNSNIHADIVKIGVFGTNGTLMIGGGSITGDTALKLYAPGSNGSIDFTANVTLASPSTAAIIAANKVTIFNGVTVTIGGSIPASVYTNIPNYTGSGGNGSTTGTFGGAGATTSSSGPPPFDSSSISSTTTTTSATAKTTSTAINVSNTTQLLSLLDSAAPSSDGKVTIPAPTNASRLNTSSQIGASGRLRTVRSAVDIQDSAKKLPPLSRTVVLQ